jgi:hypothetical protein
MKRRSCLTVFLVLIVLANLAIAIYFSMTLLQAPRVTQLAPWMVAFSAVICVGNVACAVGAWLWKRWGVIGYGGLALTSYLVSGLVTANWTNFFGLIGSSLLVVLVLPYWKQMR